MRRTHSTIMIGATLLGLAGCGADPSDGGDAAVADTVSADTSAETTVASDTIADTTVASDTITDATTVDSTTTNDTGGDVVAPSGTCIAPASAAVDNAFVPDGFCASIWASGLDSPRGMFVTDHGDVLVVERGKGQVTVLWDDDGDGVSSASERAALAKTSGLNHGVTVRGGFLYASSPTGVFRWPYTNQRADLGSAEKVVRDIPSGGHSTRTLAVDDAGLLYVTVGSNGNLDADSRRARVRRFDITTIPDGGIVFSTGEVFADGLRNLVGLTIAPDGALWGVQNGIDQLARSDLGGDIHDDNPAEILVRFDDVGAFYGYPFCWSEFLLPQGVGLGQGTLWATPDTMNDGTHNDQWCRNTANVVPPQLAMQAHSAPLDLEFYDGDAFPSGYQGDLFITFHGSWNRGVPTGYKVVHVSMAGGVAHDPEPFFEYSGQGDIGSQWPHRPVGVRVAANGQLLVTSDASGVIVAIGHEAP